MILYSIIPAEVVFGDGGKEYNYVEMDYMGVKVQAVASGNNQYVISRIISTSPAVYLNPKLQPGMVIHL